MLRGFWGSLLLRAAVKGSLKSFGSVPIGPKVVAFVDYIIGFYIYIYIYI